MTAAAPQLDDLIALNQEIANLVRAGIPLELGLQQNATLDSSRFSALNDRIAQRMTTGLSLVDALRLEGPTISPAYVAVVEAGLQSGRLPEALESLADLGLTVKDIRQRLWSSATYPLLVCGLAYLLFIGFIVFGVPMWTSTREALFLPPRFFFTLLEKMHQTVAIWGLLIPVILGCGVIVMSSYSGVASRVLWLGAGSPGAWQQIRHLLCIPGVGIVYLNLLRAQFARLLALLFSHQVSAERAVTLAAESTGDVKLQIAALTVAEQLQQGATWRDAVSSARGFPEYLRWMLVTGEQQNALPEVMLQVSETYQRKADGWLYWIRNILPVALVVLVGGGVVLMYCVFLLYPMQQFWFDLMQEPATLSGGR